MTPPSHLLRTLHEVITRLPYPILIHLLDTLSTGDDPFFAPIDDALSIQPQILKGNLITIVDGLFDDSPEKIARFCGILVDIEKEAAEQNEGKTEVRGGAKSEVTSGGWSEATMRITYCLS